MFQPDAYGLSPEYEKVSASFQRFLVRLANIDPQTLEGLLQKLESGQPLSDEDREMLANALKSSGAISNAY